MTETKQNISHAVMSQRIEPKNSKDFFPSPPYATRAFCETLQAVIEKPLSQLSVCEPACGRGDMCRPLSEYFEMVVGSDIEDRGYGFKMDFLDPSFPIRCDAIVTNPPFNLFEEFALQALKMAPIVALMSRTVIVEGVGRFDRLYTPYPPSYVFQYVERVPMFKNRLDRKGSTATSYAWVVWSSEAEHTGTKLIWIPPSRKRLEREGDYAAYETPYIPPEEAAFDLNF